MNSVLDKVRKSLGRTRTPAAVPPPPAIPDTVARLVHSPIGLPDLFNKRAAEMKMLVSSVRVENLAKEMAAFLRAHKCRTVMLSDTPLLRKLEIGDALDEAGFQARYLSGVTPDEAYGDDAGATQVCYAVAQTGPIVR